MTTTLDFARLAQLVFRLVCWNHPQTPLGVLFDFASIVSIWVLVEITFVAVLSSSSLFLFVPCDGLRRFLFLPFSSDFRKVPISLLLV